MQAEGITPDMVAEAQPYYYNPLFVQEAADAFSRKLYEYTGTVTAVKWNQWKAGDVKPDVRTETGADIDRIRAILNTGNPVLAWYVSAPMREIMYRWNWLDERGETVYWPGGEHAVVVCGYDDTSLTYRDPNAGTTVIIDCATFEKSFSELGGRIVYYMDSTD